ncbi:DNA-directed RNA polymerase subunit beta [Nocardia sp. NBC_00881]|uniref:DNA-directed RNA polymerase subunit beta n=1 Tax=Nocardia sp. NBC_00881 TaxID=2975995 RepID=UPI003862FA1B|nr:DNA-directed RNA polymerase subunit beta [Nocardia sp. NBC_00881]
MNDDVTEDFPVISADTLASRCRFYREVCGLPARVQPELQQLFIPSGSVGAITVPAKLGAAVKGNMQACGVQLGPIVSHPRSKRWTFLIRPDVPDDELALFGELFRLNASVARLGAQIALPSPTDRHGFRVWVQPPRDSYRPSGLAVIRAIRTCAGPREFGR